MYKYFTVALILRSDHLFNDSSQKGATETASFGRDDLLLLAKTLNQAHTWIYEQNVA